MRIAAEVSLPCLGARLEAVAFWLDDGLHTVITGGTRTHIGSVSLADASGVADCLQRSGHRDSAVSDMFAQRLAQGLGVPVCAACGIHYDGITRAEINEVLETAGRLCGLLLKELRQDDTRE